MCTTEEKKENAENVPATILQTDTKPRIHDEKKTWKWGLNRIHLILHANVSVCVFVRASGPEVPVQLSGSGYQAHLGG